MSKIEKEAIIKSKERVERYGEVFTPKWMVQKMCDMLQEQNPDKDVYAVDTTFLEPSCGEGAFVLEILRRKFENCKSRSDYSVAIESVYGFEILADNVQTTINNVLSLCDEYFKPSKKDIQTVKNHIIQCDSLKVLRMLHEYSSDNIVFWHCNERGLVCD